LLLSTGLYYQDNLAGIGAAYAELQEKYANELLTEADYQAGLDELNSQLETELKNINELIETMEEYYSNTLE